MNSENELIEFFEDEENVGDSNDSVWNILVVDDDAEVHKVTALVLKTYSFENKRLNLVKAYSRREAEEILQGDIDFAVAIIDVVMEEDDAGLRLVEFIRNTLKNSDIRIVLRTGQPGHAPQSQVIIEYDINDYKEKTEMSSITLITTITTSLRSFNYIHKIAQMNNSLERQVAERTEKLQESLMILESDLEAGMRIQNKLLPNTFEKIQGYNFSNLVLPSQFLSGDFVDYFEIDNHHIGFYIADVSGHGLSSSFITVLLKSFINGYQERYRSQGDRAILNPSEVLFNLNSEIMTENLNKHLTLFYGVINTPRNELSYATGAQYPYPIVYDGERCEMIKEGGMAIGLFPRAQYISKTMNLPDSFSLTLFSDGILDIMPMKEVATKEEALLKVCNGANVTIESMKADLGIVESLDIPDDITILHISRGIDG
ncbi:MAG: SpoIIE family protein phosphatase [Fibrobacterales bacterium]